jgi:peptide/nickel transport system permease protein
MPLQYLRYLEGLTRGDLGDSIWSNRPVAQDLADYLPATLELGIIAFVLAIVLGIPAGIWAATSGYPWLDRLIQLLATVGLAMPLFWFGMLLQLLFYRQLGVLPMDSRIDLALGAPDRLTGLYTLDSLLRGDLPRLASALKHLLLPAVTLSLPAVGAVARMTRAAVLDTLSQDYVRMARAKGLTAQQVIWKHVLRNALLPVVTLLGNTVNSLVAGAFVVEVIFNWPGIGWYATKVILASDYGAIVSITLMVAIFCTTVNLVVDLLYSTLDPRIQLAS